MTYPVSAYVPCYNNQETFERAICSIQAQTVPVDELFIIDDGSHDETVRRAKALGITVLKNETNLGRGATRARAMNYARCEFILSCDATLSLPPDFLEKALPHFENPNTAAVFGKTIVSESRTAAQRWTARHLYKQRFPERISKKSSMSTAGILLRKSYVVGSGNFNPTFKYSEDKALGEKLLEKGYDIICEPSIIVSSYINDTPCQLLRRYYRWNLEISPKINFQAYFRQIAYCYGSLLPQDIMEKDWGCAAITLMCPHYLFWKHLFR